jgi:hypothetical protein
LEKLLEPSGFGKSDNGYFHRNKWVKYAVGLSRPTIKLIEHVENKIPETKHIIEHPLWEILRAGTTKSMNIAGWIDRLPPEIKTIYYRNIINPFLYNKSKHPSVVQLQMAERRAGIDSLALISILLLEAISNNGRKKFIHRAIQSLYIVLLITCLELPYRRFADELFDCFNRNIFMQARPGGYRLGLELIDATETVNSLLNELSRLKYTDAILDIKGAIISDALKKLDRKKEWCLHYAHFPPLVATSDDLDLSTMRYIEASHELRELTLQILGERRREMYRSDDMYE